MESDESKQEECVPRLMYEREKERGERGERVRQSEGASEGEIVGSEERGGEERSYASS